MGRKRLRLFGRRGPPAVTKARPPDPAAIRQRAGPLEPQLDNQELARRRAAVEADLAAAMAPPPAPPAPPARPTPASPVLAVPVRRVITRTDLAICVEAWGVEVWLPLGTLHDPESPVVTHHQAGELLISSSWAARHDLPPITRSSP